MLFAKELFQMYTNYAHFRKWSFEIIEYDQTDIGKTKKFDLINNSNFNFRWSSSRQSIY
jgi:protein subunit release factor A